jgi:exodeoxyribonuclease VII small subunit
MSDAPKTFETKLERIDEIVKELESGKVALERAIGLFKEGKDLVAQCNADLLVAQEAIDAANGTAPGGG